MLSGNTIRDSSYNSVRVNYITEEKSRIIKYQLRDIVQCGGVLSLIGGAHSRPDGGQRGNQFLDCARMNWLALDRPLIKSVSLSSCFEGTRSLNVTKSTDLRNWVTTDVSYYKDIFKNSGMFSEGNIPAFNVSTPPPYQPDPDLDSWILHDQE